MPNIVIVDDELGQLEMFVDILKQLRPEYHVVQFDNPLEVEDYIRRNSTDVLITDIRMPQINGMDLIRKIRGVDGNILIVIFTAYSVFAYAKTAIELGVIEYIIKPVSLPTIISLIEKIDNHIEYRESQSRKQLNIDRKIEAMSASFIDKQIFNLINNVCTSEEYEETLSIFPHRKNGLIITTKIKYYFMLLILFSDFYLYSLLYHLKYCLYSQFHDIGFTVSAVMVSDPSRIITIIDSENALDRATVVNRLETNYRNLLQTFGIELVFGVSSLRCPISEYIASCFFEAEAEMNMKFSGEDVLFNLSVNSHSQKEWSLDEFKSMSNDMQGDKNLIYFSDLRSNYKRKINDHMQNYASEYHSILEKHIAILDNCHSCRDLYDAVNNYLVDYNNCENINNMIEQCNAYIRSNLHKNLTLEDISAKYNFNTSYFSFMYKKQTGTGFKEYLTHTRMQEASRLLKTTKLSVRQVSEKVGYSDHAYFSKCFKKEYGLTPNTYRHVMSHD